MVARPRGAVLKIRPQQLAAFAASRREMFLRQLQRHMRQHWPDECARRDDELLAAFVEEVVARATDHGFRSEVDVARYLNLAVALGLGFDRDPRYPWARALIDDDGIAPGRKMDRMCELAAEALAERT